MAREPLDGVEMCDRTLGLIGSGEIGARVAEGTLALKGKVIADDPFLAPGRAMELGVEKVELDDLLAGADAI
jgi:D-3-phosphoglycerate dehydrogenase